MRKLLKEFLSYIREEKVERKPGTAWQTAGGIWYGKNTSGETLKTGRGETAKAAAERFAKGLAAPTQAKGEEPSTDKKATAATTQPTTTKVAQPQPTAKPDVPQSQEVPMSNAPGNIPPKPLTKGSAARDEQILKDTEVAMESRDLIVLMNLHGSKHLPNCGEPFLVPHHTKNKLTQSEKWRT